MIESLIIVCLNVLLYHKTILFDIVMDDFQWYQRRKTEKWDKPWQIRFGGNLFNYLHDISYCFAQYFYGGATFGAYWEKSFGKLKINAIQFDHCFTIFLHSSICVLMYLALGHNQISFWASILFAVNPINNQTSIWLNGRRYSLNIILVLLMVSYPLLSPIFYATTGPLQVTAIFSPILLSGKSLWYLLLIPIALAVGYRKIMEKIGIRAGAMTHGDLKTFKPTRLIVIVKTFGFLFFKMLIPQVCAMQYLDRIKWGLTEEGSKEAYAFNKDFYLGIIALLGWFGLVLFVPVNLRPMAIFMGIAILQWSAVLPITQILSDRYCSLPNVFVMFFVSYFAHFSGIFYIPIMVLLGAYYYVCLSVVIPMYRNLTDWYAYHFKHFHGLSWYRHNLITDLMNEGKHEMAHNQTLEGLMQDKKDYRLLIWGCTMMMLKGDCKNAETFLQEAEKNFYINKEDDSIKEIAHLREQVQKLIPIEKKKTNMTSREQVIYMKRRGRL